MYQACPFPIIIICTMPPSRTTLAVVDDSAGQPLLWADINSGPALQNDDLTAPSGRRGGLGLEVTPPAPLPQSLDPLFLLSTKQKRAI